MKPLIVRWGTQDVLMAQEVIDLNEYDLPDKFEKEDRILDVGAHIGCFAWACRARGSERIECYEPDSENVKLLRTNIGESCCVFPNAVWSSSGQDLMLQRDPVRTAMSTVGVPLFDWHGPIVQSVSLGQAIGKRPVRLLKLDCEGSEVPILEAASAEDLAFVQEIVGELHYKLTGISDYWLEQHLKRLGFKTARFRKNKICPNLLTLFWGTK